MEPSTPGPPPTQPQPPPPPPQSIPERRQNQAPPEQEEEEEEGRKRKPGALKFRPASPATGTGEERRRRRGVQSGKDWGDYGNGGEGLGFLSSDFEEEEEEGKEWGGRRE